MDNPIFPPDWFEAVDRIVSNRRKKNSVNPDQEITEQERQEVITEALKVYDLLQEKSIDSNTKVLIEYRQGLIKMTEEVSLSL